MKAIMMSIKPQWVEKILNGEKTIEIRKIFPKDYVGWVYIYCTKSRQAFHGSVSFGYEDVYKTPKGKWEIGCAMALSCYYPHEEDIYEKYEANCRVIARFWCDKMEKFDCCCVPDKPQLGYQYFIDNGVYKIDWSKGNTDGESLKSLEDESVVFERDDDYIDTMLKNDDFSKMRLIPQQLYEYIGLGHKGYAIHISKLEIFDKPKKLSEFGIKRAPQSWQYVEVE